MNRRSTVAAIATTLLIMGAAEARADIPNFSATVEQDGRNVVVTALPNWYCEMFQPSACELSIYRHKSDGTRECIYHGDPGDDGLEPVGAPCDRPDAGPGCGRCVRLCRTVVDVCPEPGGYAYTVTHHSGNYAFIADDPTEKSDYTTLDVVSATGLCVPAALSVVAVGQGCDQLPLNGETAANDGGCGCRASLSARQALPHLIVITLFLLAVLIPSWQTRHR